MDTHANQTEVVTDITRRDFVKLAMGVLTAAAVLEVGAGSLMYLRAHSLNGKYGGTIVAGTVDTFPVNSVTEFKEGNFFLIRTTDGGFMALYRRCPHLGCMVEWSEDKQRFYCPCHASSFDMNGDFISQPVPKALDLFDVRFRDGEVLVDTSQVLKREKFSPDQIIYFHS